jgi:probable F420-dependent oxidoreductase
MSMRDEIGAFGVWRMAKDFTPELATEVEALGYGAIWLGGSPGGDLTIVESLLDVTERITIATGIVNMWRDEAALVAQAYHRIVARHSGRFLLGVGVGHREAIDRYRKPLDKIVAYLDRLEESGVPREDVVLAALGPKALALAAERTAGAHPYLTTPRHTGYARGILGDGPLLAPEHKVVLDTDPARARPVGRSVVSRYLDRVNYRANLLREGWSEADLADGGSDRLVDALVLHGTVEDVAAGLVAHQEAGADHVGIQVLGDQPLESYRELARALLG